MSDVSPKIEHTPELLADLEAAAQEFVAWLEAHANAWEQGRPGKWTVGQNAEHVASTYAVFASGLEAAERELRDGRLARRPWRDPLQALFVRVLTRSRQMPRGGKSPKIVLPGLRPERAATLAALTREVARYRPLTERLGRDSGARIWVRNPFVKRWHYTLPEVLRVQAQHTRHHARAAQEAVSG